MKDILKNMDLKIQELSNYMKITRPTLYKFIELYESGQGDKIFDKKALKILKFIDANKYASKNLIIKYILEETWENKSISDEKQELINLIKELPDEKVKELIIKIKGDNNE